MDQFQKHIKKNRKELDRIEMPDTLKIWNKIQADLADPKGELAPKEMEEKPAKPLQVVAKAERKSNFWLMARAASIALLIGLGIGYWMRPEQVQVVTFDLAHYAPELVPKAKEYKQLVNQKMLELDVENINESDFEEIFEELKTLDAEYDNWTKEVPQYVHEKELIQFLQRHYEQKIRVLEILSKEIEKKAHYERKEIRL
jgi:hypothetical protein